MNKNKFLFSVLFVLAIIIIPSSRASAATITVDSSGDAVLPSDSLCTLREAIGNANGDTDDTGGDCVSGDVGTDTIIFNAGMTIIPSLGAFNITSSIILDGTSAGTTGTCSSKDLDVIIDGSANVGINIFQLVAGSSGSVIKGFVLQNATAEAIFISDSSESSILCNIVGLDTTGTVLEENDIGIYILSSAGVTIGGLNAGDGNVITGNTTYGIFLDNFSDDTEIYGNIIGLNATGTASVSSAQSGILVVNSDGLVLGNGTASGRNIISGMDTTEFSVGVLIVNGSDNAVIKGNYFGTDITGLVTLPNMTSNIQVCATIECWSDVNPIDGVTIGGGVSGEGNIFGPTADEIGGSGIIIQSADITNVTIQGNSFGVGSDGTTIFSDNSTAGKAIALDGVTNAIIGGTTAGEGNIIAGTGAWGLRIDDSDSVDIYGNFLGFLADGVTPAISGGFSESAMVVSASINVTIGGPATGAGNIFGNSGDNAVQVTVFFQTENLVVQGNYFGVGSDGITQNIADGAINIFSGFNTNLLIGGTAAGEGNTIAYGGYNIFSGSDVSTSVIGNTIFGAAATGIAVVTTTLFDDPAPPATVTILQNNIYNNANMGIDLGKDEDSNIIPEIDTGPNANDASDVDAGPNGYLNYPVLVGAEQVGGDVSIMYSLDVPISVNPYRIEFFTNPSGLALSGYGEGEVYEDYAVQTIESLGSQSFTSTLTGVTLTDNITATVTPCGDIDCLTFLGTSEFSSNVFTGYPEVEETPIRRSSGSSTFASRALAQKVFADYYAEKGKALETSSQGEDILGSGLCPANLIVTDNMKQADHDERFGSYNQKIVTQVALLQSHINRIFAARYDQAAGPVDGIFGPLTRQGVIRLQTVLNDILKPNPLLITDGIVGPFTKDAINNSCGDTLQ